MNNNRSETFQKFWEWFVENRKSFTSRHDYRAPFIRDRLHYCPICSFVMANYINVPILPPDSMNCEAAHYGISVGFTKEECKEIIAAADDYKASGVELRQNMLEVMGER